MCILRQGNHKFRISIDSQQVEQVDEFKYLKSVIFQYGTEIRHRIALDKETFMNKKKLFVGNLSIELEK